MKICNLCEGQSKKSLNGKPHEYLVEIGELRIFKGQKPRRFKEQDYQCQTCRAKITHSTDSNNLAWTLWHG